jgi:myo-inositol-1-phosphate synthase
MSIKVAIVGVGNCASALVQGCAVMKRDKRVMSNGLMRNSIGGFHAWDIEFCAAFDVDARKVGRRTSEAIYAQPNNTIDLLPRDQISHIELDPLVQMGNALDGVAPHMEGRDKPCGFDLAQLPMCDVVSALRESGAQVMVIYLPVGSEIAATFYAHCALAAQVAVVNCIPVFLTRKEALMDRFRAALVPIVGDDIKSQVGATIVHRMLAHLLSARGYVLNNTYQLNVGGNSDFANMLDHARLKSKRESKTNSVLSQVSQASTPSVHIGPSDFVPWLRDRKVAFIRLEAEGFCGAPLKAELRLEVEDSPNSAGVVIDAIRYARVAQMRGQGGPVVRASQICMKSPVVQCADEEALLAVTQEYPD